MSDRTADGVGERRWPTDPFPGLASLNLVNRCSPRTCAEARHTTGGGPSALFQASILMLRSMRWFRQRRIRPQVIHVSQVSFLGEQDGEIEKKFKQRLLDCLATSTTLHQAYLVRATYGDSPQVQVVLALDANPDGHVVLRERAHKIFFEMFSSAQSLDILFLSEEQKEMISRVAKPFYRR